MGADRHAASATAGAGLENRQGAVREKGGAEQRESLIQYNKRAKLGRRGPHKIHFRARPAVIHCPSIDTLQCAPPPPLFTRPGSWAGQHDGGAQPGMIGDKALSPLRIPFTPRRGVRSILGAHAPTRTRAKGPTNAPMEDAQRSAAVRGRRDLRGGFVIGECNWAAERRTDCKRRLLMSGHPTGHISANLCIIDKHAKGYR